MKNTSIHTMVMQEQLRIARGAAGIARDNAGNEATVKMTTQDCINALNKLEQNLTALIAHLTKQEGK